MNWIIAALLYHILQPDIAVCLIWVGFVLMWWSAFWDAFKRASERR